MTRAVFLGSPPAAVPSLAAATRVVDIIGVVTQPDRPVGRSKAPRPTAVKSAALDWGMDVVTPDASEIVGAMSAMRPDVAIVVAYGRILREETLAIAPSGFVNVHFSLLPRWRGAAPVQHAIAAGDEVTGATLMQLDAGMDTGPVIDAVTVPIEQNDTGGALTARLASVGAELLAGSLPRWLAGDLAPSQQDDAVATRAPRLQPSDARLAPGVAAADLHNAVRAYNPRPGAWLDTEDGRLGVLVTTLLDEPGEPGLITGGDTVSLGTPEGTLGLLRVQPAGKRPMAASDWMNGRRNAPLRLVRD